ncbi:hypothetical protein [Massilia sp. Dwa41.01b]|uniref:hypothetical protein n=1 Tax=Massilia sp. Dwa41.01b TaxID=2709302 RepID=UPI002803B0AE|nr:hypothetical protein [Massilia sp. Dwa41.01b]
MFADAGVFAVQDVLTRSQTSAEEAVRFIGAGRVPARSAELRPAAVWMLAVNDDAIAPLCAELAAAGLLQGATVFHCSGAKSSAELAPARAAGAVVASVHPIRSFADPFAVAADFTGTGAASRAMPRH